MEVDADDPLEPSHYLSTVPSELYVAGQHFDLDATPYLDTKKENWLFRLYDQSVGEPKLVLPQGLSHVHGNPPKNKKGVWLVFRNCLQGIEALREISPEGADLLLDTPRVDAFLYMTFPAFKFYYQRRFKQPLKTYAEI